MARTGAGARRGARLPDIGRAPATADIGGGPRRCKATSAAESWRPARNVEAERQAGKGSGSVASVLTKHGRSTKGVWKIETGIEDRKWVDASAGREGLVIISGFPCLRQAHTRESRPPELGLYGQESGLCRACGDRKMGTRVMTGSKQRLDILEASGYGAAPNSVAALYNEPYISSFT